LIEKSLNKSISISFVTNGTLLDLNLIELLTKFKSCDVEVSLESIYENNSYIRQGSDTKTVLKNINTLRNLQNTKFQLVMRSVPQLLNINNYFAYIKWAWDNKLSIQGLPLQQPEHLAINVLPYDLRQSFVSKYQEVKNLIVQEAGRQNRTLTTGRDTSRLDLQLIKECDSMIQFLESKNHPRQLELQKELCFWLQRWDSVYKLDARKYYPEYAKFFDDIGYESI